MSNYQWSSYNGYLSHAKKWGWLHKEHIFSMITPEKRSRMKRFIAFMQEDDSEAVTRLFSFKKNPSMFGPTSFIAEIKERFYLRKRSYEVPESKRLAPTSDSIISSVCKHYGVSVDELLKTRRGIFNEPRNIAVYVLRHIRGESLESIGKHFNIRAYSTVSSILRRVSKLKKNNRKIKNRIDTIKNIINKGQ